MQNSLAQLAQLAKKRVESGYYDSIQQISRPHRRLADAINRCNRNPVIAEIKYASPSSGIIREFEPASRIAADMLNGGACGLSILTDPVSFQGSVQILSELATFIQAPLIMKDIIVSPRQLLAAAHAGADAVVLISELFSGGLGETDLETMGEEAKRLGLETIIEANQSEEFKKIRHLRPDLYGINNRNLSDLAVDLDTTRRILSQTGTVDAPVVSESGIESAADVKRLKNAGADAFLVGTSIMKSRNVKEKVAELVNA